MSLRTKWSVVILASVFGCCGCATRYNNSLVEISNEIKKERDQVIESLKENDAEKFERTVTRTQNNVNRILQKGRAIEPHDSTEGRTLHEAFEKYLNEEEKEFNRLLPTVGILLARGDRRQANAIMHESGQSTKSAFDAMKKAQQEFNKTH